MSVLSPAREVSNSSDTCNTRGYQFSCSEIAVRFRMIMDTKTGGEFLFVCGDSDQVVVVLFFFSMFI